MTAAALLESFRRRDIALFLDGDRLRYSAPPGALTAADRATIAEHRTEIVAALAEATAEPTIHCPVCGSPSWWRSPEGWRCAYCVPRPFPFLGTSLVVADTWADGRAPALDEEPGHPAPPAPVRPDDGRVQNLAGAWRTPAAHEAIRADDVHHWTCDRCQRAGRGYGSRCQTGEALHAATRGTDR